MRRSAPRSAARSVRRAASSTARRRRLSRTPISRASSRDINRATSRDANRASRAPTGPATRAKETAMATIPGVLGPIDTAELGFTLMHEHVLIANWAMRQSFADYVDVPRFVEAAAAELRAAREHGVRTMVDLTAINLGRDIHVIRAVAERSGVQIVAATGFYWTEEPWMEAWDHDTLLRYLLRDIGEGIQGTRIRAGIIKCATD